MPYAMIAIMAYQMISQYQAGQAAQDAAMQGGRAQHSAASMQAFLLDYNAIVADMQARDAVERGAVDESRYRSQVRMAIGAQRANLAEGNIDVSFGSPLDVVEDAAFQGELDALTIRNNAAREAWGFQVQAHDLRSRAYIARKTGQQAMEAASIQANAAQWQTVSSLIGSASSMMGRYGMSTK